MAFPTSVQNGVTFLSGLSPSAAAFPLGRLYYAVGDHQVGFDDSFGEPLVMKAVWSPSAPALQANPRYVGYVQVMQLCFRGEPFSPALYGGRLADRGPYVIDQPGDFRFVDFMGPSDWRLRQQSGTDAADPFYPFNAMLVDGTLTSTASFAQHPLTNGSLYYTGPTAYAATTQSAGASITAEVAVGLKTQSTITPWLTPDACVATIPTTTQALAQQEAYQIALAYLRQPGQPLEGLQNSDIGAELVGPYVLLTLPDPENERSVLCVFADQAPDGTPVVQVYLIWEDDLDSAEGDAAAQALLNVNDHLYAQGLVSDDAMDRETAAEHRGGGGLLRNPFALGVDENALELRYFTSAVAWLRFLPRSSGGSVSKLRVLSTFTWSVLFRWDEDTRRLVRAGIRTPRLVDSFDLQAPLDRFRQACAPDATWGVIDTTSFTLAAMRRDDFGASSKIAVTVTQ